MDFLSLVNRARSECSISGGDLANFSSLNAESTRFKNWVASAWNDIQLDRQDWFWMRESFVLSASVAGGTTYTPTDAGITTRFANWDRNSLRIYKTSAGVSDQVELPFMPYSEFRHSYMTGNQDPGKPLHFTILPSLSIRIGPIPDDDYTIDGDYFKSVQELSATTDIPEMPTQFHLAIVYRAMMMYARFDAANEIGAVAERNYNRMLGKIGLNQLEDMEHQGTLV